MTVARRILYVVVCAGGQAPKVDRLVIVAQSVGWDVHLFATPAALDFIDVIGLESLTGHPVRSDYRDSDQPRGSIPHADAIIVAPTTYNTINKLAAGVADNYVLALLAECIGIGIPMVILPYINRALANRAPLQVAVAGLRREGVRVLLGPGEFEPHPTGLTGSQIGPLPWQLALDEVTRLSVRPPTP
jgi:phosphopantothenoylcysteine synthetase/decarboxylase